MTNGDPSAEGDRGGDRGRQRSRVDAQENARPRVPVPQGGGERHPDQRRQRPGETEDPDTDGPGLLVPVDEQSHDQGPLSGDGQGPGDLEAAKVGVLQDAEEGVPRGREQQADRTHSPTLPLDGERHKASADGVGFGGTSGCSNRSDVPRRQE